mgnify:CR=1 FL=1
MRPPSLPIAYLCLALSMVLVGSYVALSKRVVNIRDVYDDAELKSVHPGLRFLQEVDKRTGYRTKQMLVAPILDPSGELLGVTATTALELGVDIGGLDAVIMTGYPGTIASTWQQAGRAGRRRDTALTVLVASSAPLDTINCSTSVWMPMMLLD